MRKKQTFVSDDNSYEYDVEDFYCEDSYMDDSGFDDVPLERNNTIELKKMKNFTYENRDQKTLKNLLSEKVHSVQSEVGFDLDIGDFWNTLRKHQFDVEKAITFQNDNIFDYCETKNLKDPLRAKEADCEICYGTYEMHKMYEAGCNHVFCETCYKDYITTKISQGPSCIHMKCPQEKCPFSIWDNLVIKIIGIDDKLYKKYLKYLLDDFVKLTPNFVICKTPDCPNTIEVDEKMLSKNGNLPEKDVICTCESQICLRCTDFGHEPVSCTESLKWKETHASAEEKLSNQWKDLNAQTCPKCQAVIQRSSGCNHMSCKCGAHFCYMCGKEWENHKGGYDCQVFNIDTFKDQSKSDKEKEMARVQFYLDRYRLTSNAYLKNKQEIIEFNYLLKGRPNSHLITVKIISPELQKFVALFFEFYKHALQLVAKARNFMTNTYILAFQIENKKLLDLFAESQHMLFYTLEALNKSLDENPVTDQYKVENGVYQTQPKFESQKETILCQHKNQEHQFLNAKEEYISKDFLEAIKKSK